MTVVLSFCCLSLLLILGKFLRVKVRLFQRLYLPASVIGGLAGLVILQAGGDAVPEAATLGWSALPGFLINVVFAALFLGVHIPPIAMVWRRSGPQLAYGQIVAWGQYTVGLGLTMALLVPLFSVPAVLGTIIPVGFEGGHGTAGGLKPTFELFGWAEGADYALASATMGIMSAIIVGMALINWAARRGITQQLRRIEDLPDSSVVGIYEVEQRPIAGRQTVSADSVDTLALHVAVIGAAVFIGYLVKTGLVAFEARVPALAASHFLTGFPLFPLCMLGGLLIQLFLSRVARINPVDHQVMQRLSGTAMDFLVVAAIATIRLPVILQGLAPFLLLVAAGIGWNVFCILWLAPRLLPRDSWFERGIAEMGQSMGVTATGLLLLRVVDPENETDALSAFGYKQLLHEPFMGGGLWTSMAIPLLFTQGPVLVFSISVVAIVAWLIVWALLFRRSLTGAG